MVFHRDRNRIEVSLHGSIDLGEHPTELGEHGRILGTPRIGEGIARHGKKLDAFVDAGKKIADTRRHVYLPIAAGEALHEAIIKLFDAQFGSRMQRLTAIDLVDLLELQ